MLQSRDQLNPPGGRSRRGIAAIVVLVSLAALLALLGFAVDVARLTYRTRQLQSACDAASRAAAAELMDQTPLTRDGLNNWLNTAGRCGPAASIAAQQYSLAVRSAKQYAAANTPALLFADTEKTFQLDVGWIEEPFSLTSPERPWHGRGPFNSVRVTLQGDRGVGNGLVYPVGRWFGLQPVEYRVSSTACLDRRVCGFRPHEHVRVPLIPIVACQGPDGENSWIRQILGDPTPAPVSDRNEVVGEDDDEDHDRGDHDQWRQPDGIPLVRLRLCADDDPGHLATRMIRIGSPHQDSGVTSRQVTAGLGPEDLELTGGELAVDVHGELWLPTTEFATIELQRLAAALLSERGKEKIWPLGETDSSTRCRVFNFAAGRIVDCSLDRGGLSIVIQPCQFPTSTAIVRRGMPRNPWLCKISLCR
jgi:hypothetical protein